MSLRPYQTEAKVQLYSKLGKGAKRVLVSLPRSSGSTVLAGHIVNEYLASAPEAKVLFTGHRIGILEGAAPIVDDGRVEFLTMQAITTRLGKKPPTLGNYDLVIADHCHDHAEGVQRLFNHLPNATFIGITATPWGIDKQWGVDTAWGGCVVPVTITDLQADGFLPLIESFVPEVHNLKGLSCDEQIAYLCKPEVLLSSSKAYKYYAQDRPTLVICSGVPHANAVAEHYNEQGIAAKAMTAEASAGEYLQARQALLDGSLKVITTVSTMLYGLALPVGCVIDLAPAPSERQAAHHYGAALGMEPGQSVIFVDMANNLARYGVPVGAREGLKGGLRGLIPVTKAVHLCLDCGALSDSRICASCGSGNTRTLDATPGKAKRMQDKVELVEEDIDPPAGNGFRKEHSAADEVEALRAKRAAEWAEAAARRKAEIERIEQSLITPMANAVECNHGMKVWENNIGGTRCDLFVRVGNMVFKHCTLDDYSQVAAMKTDLCVWAEQIGTEAELAAGLATVCKERIK